MNLSRPPIFLAVSALALTQCATRASTPARQSPDDDATMAPASRVEPVAQGRASPEAAAAQQGALTEPQIAMVTDEAHSAAIEQARIAYAKAKNKKVKELAQVMLADHGRMKQEETELYVELRVSPADSALATDIGVESGKALFALRQAGAAPVDRIFVNAELAALPKLVKALDEQLIPSARDERLERALKTFRGRVASHLDKAREAEKALDTETKGSVPAAPVSVR